MKHSSGIFFLLLAISAPLAQGQFNFGCAELVADAVPFCSDMQGRSIDNFFTDVDFFGISDPIAKVLDGELAALFERIQELIQEIADNNGFEVCDACVQRYKAFLCAGAFAPCNFLECLLESFGEAVNDLCPAACWCADCSEYMALDDLLSILTCEPNPNGPQACIDPLDFSCFSDWVEALDSCDFVAIAERALDNLLDGQCASALLPSQEQCAEFLSTCTCLDENNADIQAVCEVFYALGGTGIPNYPPPGDCEDVQGWCAPASIAGVFGRAQISVNSKLYFSPPGSPTTSAMRVNTNQASVAVSGDPVLFDGLDVDAFATNAVTEGPRSDAVLPRADVALTLLAAILALIY